MNHSFSHEALAFDNLFSWGQRRKNLFKTCPTVLTSSSPTFHTSFPFTVKQNAFGLIAVEGLGEQVPVKTGQTVTAGKYQASICNGCSSKMAVSPLTCTSDPVKTYNLKWYI